MGKVWEAIALVGLLLAGFAFGALVGSLSAVCQ